MPDGAAVSEPLLDRGVGRGMPLRMRLAVPGPVDWFVASSGADRSDHVLVLGSSLPGNRHFDLLLPLLRYGFTSATVRSLAGPMAGEDKGVVWVPDVPVQAELEAFLRRAGRMVKPGTRLVVGAGTAEQLERATEIMRILRRLGYGRCRTVALAGRAIIIALRPPPSRPAA
jgi:hypothetical protein